MSDSVPISRLTRNLSYKLTYVDIFETYLEDRPGPEMTELLQVLTHAQQSTVAHLSAFLRGHNVSSQEIGLNEKLLDRAALQKDPPSRLRFIHEHLGRSVSWYRMQLGDRQMTSDPEMRDLLIDAGELDATRLWRTEVVMAQLRIPLKPKEKALQPRDRPRPDPLQGWKPSLLDDFEQTTKRSRRGSAWSPTESSRDRGW